MQQTGHSDLTQQLIHGQEAGLGHGVWVWRKGGAFGGGWSGLYVGGHFKSGR